MNFHKMEVDIDGTLQLLVFSNHYYFYQFNLIFLHTGARRSGPAVGKMDLSGGMGGGGGGRETGCAVSHLSADRHCGLEPLSES